MEQGFPHRHTFQSQPQAATPTFKQLLLVFDCYCHFAQPLRSRHVDAGSPVANLALRYFLSLGVVISQLHICIFCIATFLTGKDTGTF